MVRAKFTVSSVRKTYYGGKENSGVEIKLTPQYDSSLPEDQRYATATPSGEITLYVDNPSAAEFLMNNQVLYVDFTPVPALVGGSS